MNSSITQLHHARIKYDGKVGSIAKLWYKNLLLSVLTFGYYRFWGLSTLSQYLTSCHQLCGERFQHNHSGAELYAALFRSGFYIFTSLIAIYTVAFDGWYFKAVMGLCCITLINCSVFASQSYKECGKWLGPHAVLDDIRQNFSVKIFFVTLYSFGILTPNVVIERHQHIIKHFTFAGLKGQFNHVSHQLISFRIYSLLLFIPSLGYSHARYLRALNAYIYNNTKIGDIELNYNAKAEDIYSLKLKSIALRVVSLGLAKPWIIQMHNEFYAQHLTLTGAIDISALKNLIVDAVEEFSDEVAT